MRAGLSRRGGPKTVLFAPLLYACRPRPGGGGAKRPRNPEPKIPRPTARPQNCLSTAAHRNPAIKLGPVGSQEPPSLSRCTLKTDLVQFPAWSLTAPFIGADGVKEELPRGMVHPRPKRLLPH